MEGSVLKDFFINKQPLFVLSSTRSRNEFYKIFALNPVAFVSVDSNVSINEAFRDLDSINSNFMESHFEESRADSSSLDSKNNTKILQDFNTFLPYTLSVGELFYKITYTKEVLLPEIAKDFFMSAALQEVRNIESLKNKNDKASKVSYLLSFEDNFLNYLETSNMLLNFYNELRNYKIPINRESLLKFSEIDTYDLYSKELNILANIYEKYLENLKLNDFCDCIYSDKVGKNYEINKSFLESFSSIHIELEGFISPLQYEILQNASKIIPIFLYFNTDIYNIKNFKILNISENLQKNMKYTYCIHNGELFKEKISGINKDSIKLYKSQKGFNQVNLALYLSHTWLDKMQNEGYSENDFAIILPNENFKVHLQLMDSHNIFNYAMGESIKTLQEFVILQEIYDNFLETNIINIRTLYEFIESKNDIESAPDSITDSIKDSIESKDLFAELDFNDNYEISNINLKIFSKLISILFKNYENLILIANEILSELLFLSNRNEIKDFKFLFIKFMKEFSSVSIDNVGGGKVRVMGALEARNMKFKEVLILDFNDAFIPNISQDDMFINSKIRTFYSMPTKQDKENLYKHHYYNIIRNAKTTHISYVENDKEMPSNMLLELHLPLEKHINVEETFNYYDITKGIILESKSDEFPNFNDYDISISATSLDVYNKCPRKFYFKYIEKLKPDESATKLSAGKIIHFLLQKSYAPLINKILNESDILAAKKTFYALYSEFSNAFLQSLESKIKLDNKLDSMQDFSNQTLAEMAQITDIETYILIDNLANKINEFFLSEIARVKKHKIRILALEYAFSEALDLRICTGRIDRIELVDDEIFILDYKSGKKAPDDSLQMPFYEMCARNFKILEPYSELQKKCSYVMLGKFEIKTLNYETLKNKQLRIKDIFATFGNNIMCDKINICKECEYAILCDRI